MSIQNNDIAKKFDKLADLLEIQGKNEFRVRAYRNAARTIRDHSQSIAEMLDEGKKLTDLSGIGEDLADKIKSIIESGELEILKEKMEEMPEGLSKLLDIEGIGPKSIKQLYDELNIENLDDLKESIENHEIRELDGFGKKTEEKIEDSVEKLSSDPGRFNLNIASQYVENIKKFLKNIDDIKEFEIAGSYRRRKETVGDLDILATAKRGSNVHDDFAQYDDIDEIITKGDKKTTVVLKSGLHIDFRTVPAVGYGAALMYFTGSKSHNVELRTIANENNWKLNEYGLYENNDRIAGKTEKSVYEKLGLKYIEPELRENRGEIDAAKNDSLPDLIEFSDIKGDLHAHTKYTDGKSSLNDMIKAAKNMNYEYIAITEHSKNVHVAGGLDEDEFKDLFNEIEKMKEKHDEIKILKGAEVDILEDGTLDLDDEILKEMDVAIASVHYKFNMPEDKQTERILKAMDNEYVQIIGHPTGRKLNEREPYKVDMSKIIDKAKNQGIHLELNAYPKRLDLNDIYCKMAKENGVKIAIATDAHSTDHYRYMQYGIGQARRGWLEKDDVLNTRNYKELLKLLKK